MTAANQCYRRNYEPEPMPRPMWHKFASSVGLVITVIGLLMTFGCVEADPETPIAQVVALVLIGVMATAYGLKVYFRFGGKSWV